MKKIFLLMILLSFYSVAFAEDNYQLIGSSSYETLSFDTDMIRFRKESGEMFIEVWIKHQPTAEGAKEYIQERQKNKLTTEGFENLSYYIDHKLYSLNKKSCRIDSTDYAKDESILDSKYYPLRNWQAIQHSSEEEIIWALVMQYAEDYQYVLDYRMQNN
ncbi:MAG TPA: hypothetical protein DDW50_19090 [Firmicutes bacterium]|jgi:hypothetical protein|nr:hypothetical protein [Bacillota bacterium]